MKNGEKMKSLQITLPTFEPSAADWINNHGIKCIGIDTLSVEKYGFKAGLTHKKLLSNNVGIIENLPREI